MDAKHAIAEVVHELATPLAVIRLLADAMANRPEQAVQEHARRIDAQIDRIGGILQQAGKNELHRQPHAINALITEIVDLVILAAEYPDIKLTIDLDDDAVLNIDKGQIERVLINLIRNALEAMHNHGGQWLIIRSIKNQDSLEISVIDDGPGINPAIISRLFQPYVTTKVAGMGLGLAISREIIESHSGELFVQTMGERGTCFVVKLSLGVTVS